MNKGIIAGVVVVILVAGVGGAGYYLSQNIDGIVKEMVEEIGTDTTKTKVRVAEVKLNLREGSGRLTGLTVANPDGFSPEALVTMDTIDIVIDPSSLTQDVYVIKSVTVNGMRVLAEQVGGGTNVQAMLNGMDEEEAGDGSSDGGDASEDPLFAVGELNFNDGSIALRSDLFGERSLDLPNFAFTELGSTEKGLTADELSEQVADEVLSEVKDVVVSGIRSLARDAAAEKLKETLSEGAAEGLNKLKGLFKSRD